MKRREFGKVLTAGTIGSAVSLNNTATAQHKKALMYTTNQQLFMVNDKDLQFLQRYGVKTKTAQPTFTPGKGWDLDEILRLKDKALEYNVNIDSLELPFERRVFLKEGYPVPQFMLNNSDEAERELDMTCDMIRTASKASIRVLIFCIKQIENQRTGSTSGRGGVHYSTWDIQKAKKDLGYNPKMPINEGLNKEWRWIKELYSS